MGRKSSALIDFANKKREGTDTFVCAVSLYVAETPKASIKDQEPIISCGIVAYTVLLDNLSQNSCILLASQAGKKNEELHCDWLAEQQSFSGAIFLACRKWVSPMSCKEIVLFMPKKKNNNPLLIQFVWSRRLDIGLVFLFSFFSSRVYAPRPHLAGP